VQFTRGPQGIRVPVPTARTLLPQGPYMLFVVNRAGVPSLAHWAMVS
jgi:Galactose oxidase-like, Early set domain